MNVQGRRGEISCDNKGERLIHKKKKWLWRAQPLSSSGRRDALTARTRGRRSQAPGPAAQPLVAPTIGNASGAGRRKASRLCGRRNLHLGQGLKEDTGPARGGGSAGEPLQRGARALFASGPRGGHALLCTRAHRYTQRYTHSKIRVGQTADSIRMEQTRGPSGGSPDMWTTFRINTCTQGGGRQVWAPSWQAGFRGQDSTCIERME